MLRFTRVLVSVSLFFIGFIVKSSLVQAQNLNSINPWLNTNQATLFGDFGRPYDSVSIIMPATAYASGFGSYLDNPASVSLFGTSFAEFGFTTRTVDEEAAYRGVIREYDSSDFQNSITNAGFVYVFPVDIGRLVAGGGYTQFAGYNRSLSVSSRNVLSSITDFFKTPGSIYSEMAFNTFATDFGDEFQDWDESIFRIGFDNFGEYPGISQVFTINERGYGGEYSLFGATEFRQNLMVGVSLGWVRGNYQYERDFQEIDVLNDFNSNFIDTSGDGEPDTDIDRVLLDDRIAATFDGFRVRAGVLYRITPFINAGLSYAPSTSFKVDEMLHADLATVMNNRVRFEETQEREFSYRFRTPSKTSFGLALDRYYGLTISLAADYVDYRKTELDYGDSELFDDQVRDNDEINEVFRNVWNVRAGLSYDANPFVTLRAGYANLPGRFNTNMGGTRVVSFGAGFIITSRLILDMAFQLERWEEVSSVYDFAQYDYSTLPESPPDFTIQSENADRLVRRLSMAASFVYLF